MNKKQILTTAVVVVILGLLVYFQVGLDLLWTGLIAGSAAYAVHRLRGARR